MKTNTPRNPTAGTRRSFLRNAALAAGAILVTPSITAAQAPQTDSSDARTRSRDLMDKGSPVDENLVFEFVHKSHFNFDVVKRLLNEEPQLVHASWDWGSGDFETGLGAASHMGRRDIALYLIGHGARMNLFAAAMLGHQGIIRGFLEAYPNLIDCKGPHGLSLVHHAKKGGEGAGEVLQYLNSLAKEEAD